MAVSKPGFGPYNSARAPVQSRETLSEVFFRQASELRNNSRLVLLSFLSIFAVNLIINIIWVVSSGGLKDLGSFLHSGAAHREGLNPYGYYPTVTPLPISPEALNLNPPISIYPFEALTYIDPGILQVAFLVGSLLLYTASVLWLMHAYPDKRAWQYVVVIVSLAGLWHLIYYLQMYAPLLLAVVAAWMLLRRGNYVWAGLLLGILVAFKPNYALVPLVLFVAGHYRVALPAVGVALALSAVPLIIEGPKVYWQWLELTRSFQGIEWTSNASLMSVGARFGLPIVGKLAAVGAVLGIIYFHHRYRPNVLDSVALGMLAVLLFGPVSWAGYTLFLLPFIFSRPWDDPIWAAVLLLSVPFTLLSAVALSRSVADALLGPVYAWGVLLLLFRLLSEYVDLRELLRRALERLPQTEMEQVPVRAWGPPRDRR